MNNENEIWKPIKIKNVADLYEVSNLGNVRNKVTQKLRKPQIRKGYKAVNLYSYTLKKGIPYKVHRLVVVTFRSIPNFEKYEVHHIDEDKCNNKIDNLQVLTPAEHRAYRYLNRKIGKFDSNGVLLEVFDKKTDLLNNGFCPTSVYRVCNGVRHFYKNAVWRLFPKDYQPELYKQYNLFDEVFELPNNTQQKYIKRYSKKNFTNRQLCFKF